jgi:hypothetical protein
LLLYKDSEKTAAGGAAPLNGETKVTNILAGGLRDALGAGACEELEALGDPHHIAIVYEREICGHDIHRFDAVFPQLSWEACPKAWFVFMCPIGCNAVIFDTLEDMPLPESVRNRMAALDILPQKDVDIPGLGGITRYTKSEFAGDVEYTVEITPAEYDQLVAALKGEDRA